MIDASSPREDGAHGSAGGVRSRLLRGGGAQVVTQVTTFATQILSVALFIRYWGPSLYGEWLTLAAVPSYLAISDLGFTTATAHEMGMQVARGNRIAAQAAFATTRTIVSVVAVLLVVFLTALVAVIPMSDVFDLEKVSEDLVLIVFVLSMYVAINLYCQLFYAVFYAEGRYAEGMLLLSSALVFELVFVVATLLLDGQPIHVAAALVCGRGMAAFLMRFRMRAISPWLRHSPPKARRSVARGLLRPALASTAFPLGNALSLQGVTLAVGAALGPVAVALFSTTRTMTRSVMLPLRGVFTVVQPEVSTAFGRGDSALLRRLHVRACQMALGIVALVITILMILGPEIFDLWTDGQIKLDAELFGLLLAVVGVNALWYTSLTVSYATNRHEGPAAAYVAITLSSIVASFLLATFAGFEAVAIGLLSAEVAMLVYILPLTLRLLGQNPRDFVKAMITLRRAA